MTFLLTNDDGIGAPGLAALREVACRKGEVMVVAPHAEQSGVSHRVTYRDPITVRQVADNEHAIEGTPADCTRIGLLHLARKSTWLLSGINEGGNLGSDVLMSGTVAAAREAALMGFPAIAFSQYRHGSVPVRWDRARAWAANVLEMLLERPVESRTFWNVNFPDPETATEQPEVVFCSVDPGHHAVQYEETAEGLVYRGIYQERHREPGCDVDVCFSGRIAVSLVRYP